MSFDLAVMNVETPISSEEAAEIYGELCEGNYDILKPSAKIDAFYQELMVSTQTLTAIPTTKLMTARGA